MASVDHSVTPRIALTAIRVVRAARGSTHASGSAHVTYHGMRTGPSSISSIRTHPHVAACSRGLITGAPATSVPVVRRHTATESRQIHRSNTIPTTTRTTQPSVWNVRMSTTCEPTAAGESQPEWLARSSIPSVGSCSWKNGREKASEIATARPTCVIAGRQRCSGGRRAMHHTSSKINGNPAVALTSAPTVRSATAGISRCDTTHANAAAIVSATSTSLWPLATEGYTTTGFAPKATSANAVRSGHSRRTVHTIKAHVVRLATSASVRYASTCDDGRAANHVDKPLDSADHAGPYTARVLTHIGPTNRHRASVG